MESQSNTARTDGQDERAHFAANADEHARYQAALRGDCTKAGVLEAAQATYEFEEEARIDAGWPRAAELVTWARYLRAEAVGKEHLLCDKIAEFLEMSAVQIAKDVVTAELAPPADGVERIAGESYMRDGKGRLVPIEQIRPIDKLIDEVVRKVIGYAEPLSAQVTRFRQHSFDDVDALIALIAQEYQVNIGGQKGNRTLTSIDGLMQVKVQIADNITFGPELEAAKALVDECLKDWTEGSRSELRAIVDRAFQVDKEGKINRGELLGLRRLSITDERWVRAMKALDDSIRIVGSKRYVRCYKADKLGEQLRPIVIDVAAS